MNIVEIGGMVHGYSENNRVSKNDKRFNKEP